ncbi:MAG: hypothetical protein M1351_01375 [Candidatus Thermoplasmatota archaeon]|nr:hypothetical protein [Candidatus Thermoplasmatota archaeon]
MLKFVVINLTVLVILAYAAFFLILSNSYQMSTIIGYVIIDLVFFALLIYDGYKFLHWIRE